MGTWPVPSTGPSNRSWIWNFESTHSCHSKRCTPQDGWNSVHGHPYFAEWHHTEPARMGSFQRSFYMSKRRRVFAPPVSLALLYCSLQSGFAQNPSMDPVLLPLTVPVGAPLHIVLTKRVPVKHAGVSV